MQRFSATFRIAVALASLSVCVLVIAHVFELLPDRQTQIIQNRAVLCESIAISCAAAAAKKDLQHLEATLNLLTQRRPEVLSASIVDRTGKAILTVDPRHDSSSVEAEVVTVPLLADNSRWGELTLRFRPVERGMWGFTSSRMRLIGFITALNCLAFFWYLRRILQHLNPSKVIPPRVRSTLDTFAEGLLVLNRDHRIVLANDAFARTVGERPDDLQGRRVDQLPWQKHPDEPEDAGYPWERALQESTTQTGSFVSLKTIKDFKRTFMVNVAPVIAEDGGCHGVLASFDDVTEIQQRNAVLRQMLAKLEDSREKIRKQNEELKQLATRDPLTACLNRRAFFEVFESHFSGSQRYEKPLTCILLDVDHFKDVNDQHGHAVGDEVLKQVAEVVRGSIRRADQLCRYGGEEFCIALPEQDVENGYFVANKVREAIQSADIRGLRVTASLGVTASDLGADTAQRLMQQADEALYAAKRTGRNRVCRWDNMPEQSEMMTECQSHDPIETSDQLETIVPFHTVQALFSALFFRAPSVAEHCRRVADYCVTASENTIQGRAAYLLEVAALLHEVGRIGLPDTILFHDASLSSENQQLIASYDRVGLQILRDIFSCEDLNGLLQSFAKGDTSVGAAHTPPHVIKAAHVLRIADRFDSLTHQRNGQRYRSHQDALVLLRHDAGNDLDEELLQRFIQAMAIRDQHVDPREGFLEESKGGVPTEEFAVLDQLRRILSQLNRQPPKTNQAPLPSKPVSL